MNKLDVIEEKLFVENTLEAYEQQRTREFTSMGNEKLMNVELFLIKVTYRLPIIEYCAEFIEASVE